MLTLIRKRNVADSAVLGIGSAYCIALCNQTVDHLRNSRGGHFKQLAEVRDGQAFFIFFFNGQFDRDQQPDFAGFEPPYRRLSPIHLGKLLKGIY
ncbi:hypothetical protein D3C76_1696600 [compost metagenome]